jgi:indole-3-glycerol phosphate synthase
VKEYLEQMARESRRRVTAARGEIGEASLLRRAMTAGRVTPLRLVNGGFGIIPEFARIAPSEPRRVALDSAADFAQLCRKSPITALSIVTEPNRAGGRLADLEEACVATKKAPVIRHDFIVDPYQVMEARAAGASAIVLVTALLDDVQLEELLDAVRGTQMLALLEVFEAEELRRTREVLQRTWDLAAWVCVNRRDPGSGEIVPGRLHDLADLLPRDIPAVAAGGLRVHEMERLQIRGYKACMLDGLPLLDDDAAAGLNAMRALSRGDFSANVESEEP